MIIKSIGLKTNLIFNSMSGNVTYKNGHIVVKTPSRPDYIWGNYIVILASSESFNYKDIISFFEKEVGNKYKIEFVAIAFDSGFNSKSTFNSIFKQQTESTPSTSRRPLLPILFPQSKVHLTGSSSRIKR